MIGRSSFGLNSGLLSGEFHVASRCVSLHFRFAFKAGGQVEHRSPL
jgi:hypothetical protein